MHTQARARLAERQTALLSALVGRGPVPEGFDPRRVAISCEELQGKRIMAVEKVWGGLARSLGDGYPLAFAAYAKKHLHPLYGHGLADGRRFALELKKAGRLPDEAKLELLEVELRSVVESGRIRRRRGFAFGAVVLANPRRFVFGLRVPLFGIKLFGIGSPALARRSMREMQRRSGALGRT